MTKTFRTLLLVMGLSPVVAAQVLYPVAAQTQTYSNTFDGNTTWIWAEN